MLLLKQKVSVNLSTNLLTATTDSVSISIGPNVSVSTNLLETTINSVEIDCCIHC
jgi:hypothetical protein